MKNVVKYTGLFIIVLFCALSVYHSLALRTLPHDSARRKYFSYTGYFEDRFFDFRMRKSLDPNAMEEDLVLADIDDFSLNKISQWPIARDNWATFIRKLKIYGAKVIAFDVFFSETSRSCNGINVDDEMAKAIEEFHEIPNNRVILPYNLLSNSAKSFPGPPEDLYAFGMTAKTGGVSYDLYPTVVTQSVYPIQKFIDTEVSLGFIEAQSDDDGIIRHYKAVANLYDQIHVPSYGLRAYSEYIGEFDEDPNATLDDLANQESKFQSHLNFLTFNKPALVTEKGRVYLNGLGETKLRWFGGADNFKRVPIYHIITKPDDDPEMHKAFKGKLVFVGSTAFGADDLRHTPVDPMLPGVFFHMNFVKMLLDGNFLKPFEDSVTLSWGILIFCVLLLLLIQLKENPIADVVAVIVIIGSVYYYDTYHLIPDGYEVRLFFCFFAVLGCYSWNTFVHFYMANKDKAFLKSAFGSYISPELIDEMYENGEAPKLGGDSGIRTAFFTDIQGFSTFSEKLSATQLVELLNEYLTVMTDILLHEKGTLDKYEGDAIIAFFGAPMPLEDHARRACLVAHQMQEALLVLREKWISEGDKWPTIVHEMRMRIGINSGEIVTGNMGSASRMNYTMMGDTVNLAARLEESAKQYGIFTQVAKEAAELAGDEFIFRELDTIRVVGKSIPVTSYDLLGLKETAPTYLKVLAKEFKVGIELYKAQRWDQAIEKFKETLELEYERFPALKGVKTNPSEIYIKRCEEYKENPPGEDWDGVYTLTSK